MDGDYLRDGDDLYDDLIFGVSTSEPQEASHKSLIPPSTIQDLSINDPIAVPQLKEALVQPEEPKIKDVKSAYQSDKEVRYPRVSSFG